VRFSPIFHKALDSIASIIPDNEADWERVLDTLPDPLRNGLHVAVFDDIAHGIFVCYAVILGSERNVWTGDYSYDVQVCQSKQRRSVWGFHLEQATPETMRLGFVKVEGGFPEFARKS
jgi:hypothetical protein